MAILLSKRAESAGILIPRAELGPMEEALPVDLMQLLHPIPPGLSQRALAMEEKRRGTASYHAYTGSHNLRKAELPTDQPAPRQGIRTRYEGSQAEGDMQRAALEPVKGPPAFRDLNDLLSWAGGVAQRLGALTRNPVLAYAGGVVTRSVTAAPPTAPTVSVDGSGPLEAVEAHAAMRPTEAVALEFSKGSFDPTTGKGTVEVIGGVTREFSVDVGIRPDGTPADVDESGDGG